MCNVLTLPRCTKTVKPFLGYSFFVGSKSPDNKRVQYIKIKVMIITISTLIIGAVKMHISGKYCGTYLLTEQHPSV